MGKGSEAFGKITPTTYLRSKGLVAPDKDNLIIHLEKENKLLDLAELLREFAQIRIEEVLNIKYPQQDTITTKKPPNT